MQDVKMVIENPTNMTKNVTLEPGQMFIPLGGDPDHPQSLCSQKKQTFTVSAGTN